MVLEGRLIQGRGVHAIPGQVEQSTQGREVLHTTVRVVQDTQGLAELLTMAPEARPTRVQAAHVTQGQEGLVTQAQVVPVRTVPAFAVKRRRGSDGLHFLSSRAEDSTKHICLSLSG